MAGAESGSDGSFIIMNERTKTGLAILQVAAIVGILGDVLLRAMPWGLNVLLFNAAFAGGMIMLLRRHKPEYLTRQTYALFGALVFFSSMFAWSDSIELRLADTLAIIAILSVLFLPRMSVRTQFAGVSHYFIGFVWSGVNAVFTPIALVFADIEWNMIERNGWSKHLFSVLRGIAIVAPILLVFGGLFVAADAVYEGWIERIFNIRPEIVFTHLLLTGVFAWFSAGYLRGVLVGNFAPAETVPNTVVPATDPNLSKVENTRTESVENPSAFPNNLSILEHINISDSPNTAAKTPVTEPKQFEWATFDNTVMPPIFTLGTVEISIILGLTNLLFLSFVIVQVPYLFGGMNLVQATPDFKLADYARRGFGELVTVSALVLPILLASHWLIKRENPFTEKVFRIFAGVQIALLFVIMASAVQRLVLLTGNLGYGLTTIRLYPMIFMIWLAIVFVWFGLTVLRGSRRHFAWGALWSAFVILGVTHVLNPDAFIVKTNIALMHQGREFDAVYNAGLSQDSVPILLSAISELGRKDQCIVRLTLWGRLSSRNEQEEGDLRSWNLSRLKAAPLLIENTKALHYDNASVPHTSECSELSIWRGEEAVP